jgi:molybdate transport system substrate-binding protein
MNKITRVAHLIAFAVVLICSQVNIAFCAEIRVLSAVAMKTALDDLAREFESTAGHKITISYATAGKLRNSIQGGEFADVAILPRPAFEPLLTQGNFFPDSPVKFAQSSVGVSVRAGGPKPNISSAEAVRRSLLSGKINCLHRSGAGRCERCPLCART